MYNALAATSLANGVGIDLGRAMATSLATEAAFGRVQRVELRGRTLWLLLVKNPAGFTQVLDTFLVDRSDLHVMFVINDLAADGRDVSWLWDVPLEALAPTRAYVVVVGGIRGADMAVRLYYAGVACTVSNRLGAGIDELVRPPPKAELRTSCPLIPLCWLSAERCRKRPGCGRLGNDRVRSTIAHLYPREMSIYGDVGNVITLRKRLEWRGYKVAAAAVEVDEPFDFSAVDIVFGGGGRIPANSSSVSDLIRRGQTLRGLVADGVPRCW